MQVYSLTDLNLHIRQTLDDAYPEPVWISAEIASFNRNAFSGHCYLELVEGDGQPARAKAMIWKKTFDILNPKFEVQTGITIQKGLKIQMLVKVEFNVQYGLSLIVWDLDADFTLGEMARKRVAVLRRLAEQGLDDRNKSIPINQPVQRLAIISSATAAGYQDFMTHLSDNDFGFAFQCRLFEAQMQGIDGVDSLKNAFEKIAELKSDFDVVVVIRGGGSTTDLLVFDEFEVAKALAMCPLPVLTGIGHERDESVCDRVAHSRFKTPTAVADWLIGQMLELDSAVSELLQGIFRSANWKISETINGFQQISGQQNQAFTFAILNRQKETRIILQTLGQKFQTKIFEEKERLNWQESQFLISNPLIIMGKGYGRLSQDGKLVRHKNEILANIPIQIQLIDGKLEAEIL